MTSKAQKLIESVITETANFPGADKIRSLAAMHSGEELSDKFRDPEDRDEYLNVIKFRFPTDTAHATPWWNQVRRLPGISAMSRHEYKGGVGIAGPSSEMRKLPKFW